MRRILTNKLFILSVAIVLLLTLAAVSYSERSGVNILSNIISVPAAPFQRLFTLVSGEAKDLLGYFKDIQDTKTQNEELNRRVSELEQQNLKIAQLEQENQELKDLLNFMDQYEDYNSLGGNIIAKDPGNWFEVFTINRGVKDGVAVDAPVITAYGLVGRVSKTELLTSRVVSIIDMDSTVTARLSKSRDYVVVRGDVSLRSQGLCRADYIPPDVDVMPGDMVETSGMGGIYPKGIIIGKVVEVVRNEGQYDSYAIIKPLVDFKRLEDVVVLQKKP